MSNMEVDSGEDEAFKRPLPPKAKNKEKKSNFTIFEIFNFAQKEETDLNKVVKKMAEMYQSISFDKFVADVKKCIQFTLAAQEKCKQVDKCLSFIIKFIMRIVTSQAKKAEENKQKTKDGEKKAEDDDEEEDEEPNHPLLRAVFFFLFEISNVEDSLIRYRVCYLITKLLAECTSLDDDVYDEISRIMLERIKDKVANIRVQAVNAVYKLQDKSDPNCPIKAAFKFHLSVDPSADVRRSVVRFIAIHNDTISVILGRLDDTSDKVRKHVYLAIAKQNISNLTIKQRQTFIQKGLNDRHAAVRNAVENTLLPMWFSRKGHNYMDFLDSINIDNNFEEWALKTLETLAKQDGKRVFVEQFQTLLNDRYLIPLDKLNANNTLFWRFVTCYLAKEDRTDEDETLLEEEDQKLPKLTDLAKYIRAYFNQATNNDEQEDQVYYTMLTNFILIQLLTIAKLYDFKDEVGKSHMQQLCIDLLKSHHVVTAELITAIIELFALIVRNDDTRLDIIAEVIADLREPLVNPAHNETHQSFTIAPPPGPKPQFSSIQQARLTVALDVMEESLRVAVDEGDFEQAKELCQKVSELKAKLAALGGGENSTPKPSTPPRTEDVLMVDDEDLNRTTTKDPVVVRKCLRIIIETLQIIQLDHLTPTLRSLVENVIIPTMTSEDHQHWDFNESLAARRDAVEALGLLCLMDEFNAVERMPIFIVLLTNAAMTDVCLKTIFDLLCKYGLDVFGINPNVDEYLQPVGRQRVTDGSSLFRTNVDTRDISGRDFSPLIGILITFVESPEYRNRALVGLCKLLFIGRIRSSILLSKLIVFWFSPDASSDLYVQQQLGNFFSKFAAVCPQAPPMLQEATLPAVDLIVEAPAESPLAEVDYDNALKLLIQLTKVQKCSPPRPHDVLARDILMSIIERKNKVPQLTLIKALFKLEISFNCPDITEELLNLVKSSQNVLTVPTVKQKMKTFREFMESESSNNQKSTLINTRITLDNMNSRATMGSENSRQSSHSTGSSVGMTLDEDEEYSQAKADDLERRTSLLHLNSAAVVQEESSDEEIPERDSNDSLVSRRHIIPPTPEPSDVDSDDDSASTCSNQSEPKVKRSRRRM